MNFDFSIAISPCSRRSPKNDKICVARSCPENPRQLRVQCVRPARNLPLIYRPASSARITVPSVTRIQMFTLLPLALALVMT